MRKLRLATKRLGESRKIQLCFTSIFIIICINISTDRCRGEMQTMTIQQFISIGANTAHDAEYGSALGTRDLFSTTTIDDRTVSIVTSEVHWLVVIRIYIGISVAV